MELRVADIGIRLLLACVFAGIIGWEREFNSRPAGLRTHILVCVGAAIVAMIQTQIMWASLEFSRLYPALEGVIRSDPARLIAQVVSGIGFLGAGTIVVTRSTIRGLTTAASLWATAGLGLAIGMGYYNLALISMVVIFAVLTLLKRIIHLPTSKKIEVKYHHRKETKTFIEGYFAEHGIKVRDSNLSIQVSDEGRVYTHSYTIELPKGLTYVNIAEDLSEQDNITEIRLTNL